MNNHWCYCNFDHEYKSAKMLIRKLVECISKGKFNRVIVHRDGKIKDIDMEKALSMSKTIDASSLDAVRQLF